MITKKRVIGVIGIILLLLYGAKGMFFKAESSFETMKIMQGKYGIFIELFDELDYDIVKRHGFSNSLDISNILLVFDYSKEDRTRLKKVDEWVKKGGTLFIIGVNNDVKKLYDYSIENGKISKLNIDKRIKKDVDIIPIRKGKYFKETTGLISSKEGALLVQKKIGGGTVYLFSNNNFFKREIIKNESVAILINNIFKPFFEREIVMLLSRERSDTLASPIALFFSGKFLYVTLHIIIILILFSLLKGWRYGKAQILDPYKRTSVSEHIEAVAVFYNKCKKLQVVDTINAEFFRYRLYKLIGKNKKSQPNLDKILLNVEKESALINNENIRYNALKNLKKNKK